MSRAVKSYKKIQADVRICKDRCKESFNIIENLYRM